MTIVSLHQIWYKCDQQKTQICHDQKNTFHNFIDTRKKSFFLLSVNIDIVREFLGFDEILPNQSFLIWCQIIGGDQSRINATLTLPPSNQSPLPPQISQTSNNVFIMLYIHLNLSIEWHAELWTRSREFLMEYFKYVRMFSIWADDVEKTALKMNFLYRRRRCHRARNAKW